MEFTRRNFIKFLVGGVAGIHATPLPWKLIDDSAIWTQNWPWVPVPPAGAFTHVDSICTLCPGGCGIRVRKADERAVKIDGRGDYPVNPGGLCPIGSGGLQLLYDRDLRFPGPMKRVGPRGAGLFANISWDEALDTLAARITALREQGKPGALAAVDGNRAGGTLSALVRRLLQSVGSPAYQRLPSLEDTYGLTLSLMFGASGPMAYDLENADYILSFGGGLLEGWGAPGRVLNAWGLWHPAPGKSAARVVQVESRASNTASKADQWVPARPGTEGHLALALAHVLIREKLYDAAFVEAFCADFEAFAELALKGYAPARVAEATGLKAEAIVALAHDFAGAKAPLAVYGKGKGTLNGSLHESLAVHALNALKGNINRPGGMLVPQPLPLSPLPEPQLDGIARKGLEAGHGEPALDTLLVFGANPAYTLPDGGAFRHRAAKIPYLVSFSPYRDETALLADLVLPDHTYLEKRDDLAWPEGLQYPLYGLSQPVVAPVYDTRHSGDVLIQLARRLGGAMAEAFPWESYDEVLETRVRGLFESPGGLVSFESGEPVWERITAGAEVEPDYDSPEDLWAKIRSGGLWYRPAHTFENWEELFSTPSAKLEFRADLLVRAMGAAAGEPAGDDPIMVPYGIINLASGWVPSPPFLNKTLFDHQLRKEDSFLEMNPATAAGYGLREGDRVTVASAAGEGTFRVHLFHGAMPGCLYVLQGLGHTGL